MVALNQNTVKPFFGTSGAPFTADQCAFWMKHYLWYQNENYLIDFMRFVKYTKPNMGLYLNLLRNSRSLFGNSRMER
jgi:hypothetical protein